MHKLEKFHRLSPMERKYLLCAAVLLPVISSALRVLGLRRTRGILIRMTGCRAGCAAAETDPARATLVARMVAMAAGRCISRPRCLQRSLVLWFLLNRRGMEAEMWFGVDKNQDGIQAHAWIEYQGRVLNDRADVRGQFAAFRISMAPAPPRSGPAVTRRDAEGSGRLQPALPRE